MGQGVHTLKPRKVQLAKTTHVLNVLGREGQQPWSSPAALSAQSINIADPHRRKLPETCLACAGIAICAKIHCQAHKQ